MEELVRCAKDYVDELFGAEHETSDILVDVYVYIMSASEPRMRLDEIRQCIAMNDYVGFNRKLAKSGVRNDRVSKSAYLRREFPLLGQDLTKMFPDWRVSWRRSR